jgi:Fe2+ transport system protein FeoA
MACRDAGCPIAQVNGCSMVCCPNCGYQMPDKQSSVLVGLIERIQGRLTHPKNARHSAPTVRSLRPGETAIVADLAFKDADRLDQLCAFGLAPGCTVQVEQTDPVVILRIGGTTLSVDYEIADGILITHDEAVSS